MNRILPLVVFPLLGGCFIHLKVTLNFLPSGRVERASDFATDTRSELEENYSLPRAGNWTADSVTKGNPTWHYTVREQFADFRKVTAVYVRKGGKPDRVSSSRPRFRVKKYFFFTDYEYREEFYDVADTARARASFRELRDRYRSSLEKRMGEEGFGAEAVGRASAGLGRWWDEMYEALRTGKKFDDMTDETVAGRLQALVADTGGMVSADRQRFLDRMNRLVKSVDEDFSPVADSLTARFAEEGIFGVYGIAPLSEYAFEVAVVLPGRIVASNGARAKDGSRWTFRNRDFFSKPYVLHARSRTFHPVNTIIASVGYLALVALIVAVRRRRMLG